MDLSSLGEWEMESSVQNQSNPYVGEYGDSKPDDKSDWKSQMGTL